MGKKGVSRAPLLPDVADAADAPQNMAERLARTAADLEQIWRNSRDLITVIDMSGVIRSVNPAAEDILGWSAGEMVGRSVLDFIHPEDHPPVYEGGLMPERYAEPRIFLNRFLHKNGDYRPMSWLANAAEDGLIYSSGRDLTDERAQAQALEAAQERLRQSQKMEAVGQLTGGIAHDFNNLLMGITGSLEVMQQRISLGQTDDLERYVSQAQIAAKRAAALTHRLLAFSRRQTLDPKPAQPLQLISNLVGLVGHTVGPSIELVVTAPEAPWAILVDANQLENALLNLCLNARDAMPDGGRITIGLANLSLAANDRREDELPPGDYLAISVTDTGSGMTADVMAQAFDPFFTTKPQGSGTGLGLSMVYGFVGQSGGQVIITSMPGDGTTMRILLPRFAGAVAEPEAPVPVPADIAPAPASGTVLVVDDEPLVRLLVTEALGEAGYTILEADDGHTALKILRSPGRIDLLVSDVGLPGGMNGRQMADAARSDRPDLKVLFVTGYAANAAMGQGALDPGMAVLIKPFGMEELRTKVAQMMREPGSS